MEVERLQPLAEQWMVAGYAADAGWATEALLQDALDSEYLESVCGLLNTFVRWKPFIIVSCPAAQAMVALANASFKLLDYHGHWRKILIWWPAFEETAQGYNDVCGGAELRVQRATIQNYCNQLDQVEQTYRDYLNTPEFKSLPDQLQAKILLQAGICYLRQGKNKLADSLLNQCLALSTGRDPFVQVCTLNQLGNLAMSQGDAAAAERYYLECLANCERFACASIASVARCSLGRLYAAFLHRPQDAIQLLEQNMTLPLAVTGVDGAAESAACLAMAYAECGSLKVAWELACQSLATFQNLDNHYGISFCRIVLGRVQQRKGNLDEAALHWRTALDVLGRAGTPAIELYVLALLVNEFLDARRWGEALGLTPHLLTALLRQRVGLPTLIRHFLHLSGTF